MFAGLSPNRPSTVWSGKPKAYHAFRTTLIPQPLLSPTLTTAVRDDHLRCTAGLLA